MPSATLTPSCNSTALASKLSNYAVGYNVPAQQIQEIARAMGVDEGTVVAVTDDPVVVSRTLVAMEGDDLDGLVEDTYFENLTQEAMIVQTTIEERVTARLNERLAAMSVEERANARGLLRLQEQGRLDEYFDSLFMGTSNPEVDAAVSGGGYSVYHLIDKNAVSTIFGNAGHAAMIMGSESEGWYFFSFGVGTPEQGPVEQFLTSQGNMEVEFYTSLDEARRATDRYTDFLRWNVENVYALRAAFRAASYKMSESYNFFNNNCDEIASDIIRAANIPLDNSWIEIPIVNHLQNESIADEIGEWPLNDE